MRLIAINVAWYAWIVYWFGGATWLLTTNGGRLEAVGPLLLLAAVIAVVGGRMALEPSESPLEISTSGTFYELHSEDSSHKQGCPALGGYGTPDRTCICKPHHQGTEPK